MAQTFSTLPDEASAPASGPVPSVGAPEAPENDPVELQGIVRWFQKMKGFGVIKVSTEEEGKFTDYFVYYLDMKDQLYDGLEVVFDGTVQEGRKVAKNVRYLKDSDINKEILYKIHKIDLHYDVSNYKLPPSPSMMGKGGKGGKGFKGGKGYSPPPKVEKPIAITKLYDNQVKIVTGYFVNKKLYYYDSMVDEMAFAIDLEKYPRMIKLKVADIPDLVQNRGPLDFVLWQMSVAVIKNPEVEIEKSESFITYDLDEGVIIFELNVENNDRSKYKLISIVGKATDLKLVHNYSNVKTMIRLKHSMMVAFGTDVCNDWTVKYTLENFRNNNKKKDDEKDTKENS